MAEWQAADPSTKTLPALHYIATTAQGSAGRDGKYRLRMPFHQIDTIMNWASQINALVFVDIQVGHSTMFVKRASRLLSNAFRHGQESARGILEKRC